MNTSTTPQEQIAANRPAIPAEVKRYLFDVFLWRRTNSDHFTVQLFQLMAKADSYNRAKLYAAFPDRGAAFKLWSDYQGPEDEFFAEHNLV